jgi:hypothetical protein
MRCLHLLVLVPLGALLASCLDGGSSDDSPIATVQVTGDGQEGVAGALLPQAIVVVALDAQGNPLPGRKLTFMPAPGDGTIDPPSGLTGSDGSISVQWQVGMPLGQQQASVATDAPGANSPQVLQQLSAHVCARSQVSVALKVLSGDAQQAPAYQFLPAPIVVGGIDSVGNPSTYGCDGSPLESTFAFSPASPDDPWAAVPRSFYDVPLQWVDNYYHAPGVHHIVASAAYLQPVPMSVNVLPNPHVLDGYYDCVPVDIYIQDGLFVENHDDYHDIHPGYLDEADGTFTGTYFASLDYRDEMTGVFGRDADGNGTGHASGTYQTWNESVYPRQYVGSGTWWCNRY